MDFLCVCVRIPKCASTSLTNSLESAFAGRGVFYLPHTLDVEGSLSALQKMRFYRALAQNLMTYYGTTDLAAAYDFIGHYARNGALISGGHIDFVALRRAVKRNVKIITILREPIERSRSEYEYCRRMYLRKRGLSRIDAAIKHKMAARYSFAGYLDFLLDHKAAYANPASRYIGWDGQESLAAYFLRHVFYCGVLKHSTEFASSLARKIGRPVSFPHDNRSAETTEAPSGDERRRIETLDAHDIALYQWQLQRLSEDRRYRTEMDDERRLMSAANR